MDYVKLVENTWNQSKENLLPLLIVTLVFISISVVTFGILAPAAYAGYYRSIHQMVKYSRVPQARDVFSELRLFFPLLLFSVASALLIALGFFLLLLPGILISFAIAFSCLYMIPLMVDKNLGLFDAVKESYAMSRRGSIFDHIIVMLMIFGVQFIGGSFILGTVLTTPLTAVFLVNVYEYKCQNEIL